MLRQIQEIKRLNNSSGNGSVGVPSRRVSGAAAVSNPNPMAGALG